MDYKLTSKEAIFVANYEEQLIVAQNEVNRLKNELSGALRMICVNNDLKSDYSLIKGVLVDQKTKVLVNPEVVDYTTQAFKLGLAGSHIEAVEKCNQALAKYPTDTSIRHERAFHELLLKDYKNGWEDWEYRNTRLGEYGVVKIISDTVPGLNEWHGESLVGKKLLIVCEGGLGDALMYMRYFKFITTLGGSIVFCCKSVDLARLAESLAGVKKAVGGSEQLSPAGIDYWVGLYSLPYKLQMFDLPPAPLNLGIKWNPKKFEKLRIGIAWHGDDTAVAAAFRPNNLEWWKPLTSSKDVEFVSLQLNEIPDFCKLGLDPNTSLLDTAKFIATECDMVITCDCLILHMCGSIGIPTWGILHQNSYWMFEPGEKSVWYPDARIIRMDETEGWTKCFEKIADAVSNLE